MSEKASLKDNDSIPFYPDHVRSEIKVVLGIMAVVLVIGVIALWFPLGLGDPADPMNTPTHVKPEWYFLALYQALKFIPKTTGAVIPVVGLIVFALLPFFDRRPDRSPRSRRVRLGLVIAGLALMLIFTLWGELS